MSAEANNAMDSVSPDLIEQIATGFMASKLLFVASEVGLFEHLAAGPTSLSSLADQTGIPASRLRVLVNAMVALALVERQDDGYRNGPASAAFLSGQTPTDLRPQLRLLNRLVYPMWTKLEDAVRTGQPQQNPRTEEEQRIFSEGVEASTAAAAQALPATYDFSRHQRVLDLGGGTGSWLIAILQRFGHLHAALFDRPGAAAIARQRLAGDPSARHAAVVEGDFFRDPIPQGYDAILVANVLHATGPERNVELLRRIRASAPQGARLLLADGWTDPTHARPLSALLRAGSFLTGSGQGDVYSEEEANAWLRASGWRPLERKVLAGPHSLIVAETVDAS